VKLEQAFEVEAPIDRVWAALIDVERVAPCLPGAEITEVGEDGRYEGTFQVKLGPTSASYRGTLEMESVDEAAHVVTMRGNGQDKRGQGSAKATIVSTLRESGSGTAVEVVTDFTITGRLARFGRSGMIQDISNRLLRDFAGCLEEMVGQEPEAAGQAAAGVPASGSPTDAASAPADAVAAPGPGELVDPSQAPVPPAPVRRPAPAPARPVHGLSLFFSVLLERLKRLVGRGG